MENMIPFNGRIAIVDDQIKEAMLLIRIFSKNNIPYTYYPGNDIKFLPEEPENDIRILFLDLNLLEGRDYQPRDIESTLYSVINRLISPNNFPYVIILWSKQEKEYKEMLEKLFHDSLSSRAPIRIMNWIKSDFFPLGVEDEVNKEDEDKIIIKLKEVLFSVPSYSHLILWENCVHNSANTTLREIYKDFNSQDNWLVNANCILDMFAHSYLERHYEDSSIENRVKASLLFLNDVYYDTLEANISNITIEGDNDLNYSAKKEKKEEIASLINKSLLFSSKYESLHQPGCVLLETNDEAQDIFLRLLDNSILTLPSKINKENLQKNIKPCKVIVTPACDYAQNKNTYDRIVQGVIIDAIYRQYIDKSEAIYVSPIFKYQSTNSIMVLNFRYFVTADLGQMNTEPIFRLRNTILAEIQSRLARHINRQGIMNL